MDDSTHILLLNTKAVNTLICSGNCGEAALLLREALRLIESTHQEQEEYVLQRSSQPHHQSSLAIRPVQISQQLDPSSSPTYEDQGSIFMYDRAFHIAPQVNLKYDSNSEEDVVLSQEQRIKVTTVLLFNLALCFHLQGMKNPRVRERCFHEANTFYLMSYGLLDPTSSSQAEILLQLALLNNRGAICCSCQEMKEAQLCLDDLRFALDDLMYNYAPYDSSSSSSASSSAISNEDCVVFFKNILYNGRLDARAAPVA